MTKINLKGITPYMIEILHETIVNAEKTFQAIEDVKACAMNVDCARNEMYMRFTSLRGIYCDEEFIDDFIDALTNLAVRMRESMERLEWEIPVAGVEARMDGEEGKDAVL